MCFKCELGRFLIRKTCELLPPGCIDTVSASYCLTCGTNFVLVSNVFCYPNTIATCPLGTLPRNSLGYCLPMTINNCQVD